MTLAAVASSAFAVGLKNDAWSGGFASRHVTLPALFPCVAYISALLYGSLRIQVLVSWGACTLLAMAAIPNAVTGLDHAREQRKEVDAFIGDLHDGIALEIVAKRHWRHFHTSELYFLHSLKRLRQAQFAPFTGSVD